MSKKDKETKKPAKKAAKKEPAKKAAKKPAKEKPKKAKAKPKSSESNGATATVSAAPQNRQPNAQPQGAPFVIHAQYVRDASFENPHAINSLRPNLPMPEMDINIGLDARRVDGTDIQHFYEVAINVRAEAKRGSETVFITELQYGIAVSVDPSAPEDAHHPLLFIEIPRLAFPYARQILSDMTVQGGYPPLLLNPVDFHALYLQRFGQKQQ